MYNEYTKETVGSFTSDVYFLVLGTSKIVIARTVLMSYETFEVILQTMLFFQ